MNISVVIPCFNYSQFIKEAVKSCVTQTQKPNEIIIVDDCSSDNSWEVIHSLHNQNQDVRLISHRNNKNRGAGVARNKGIELSSGDYILLLDADDKLHFEFIEKTAGKNDIVSSWVKMFGLSRRELCFKPNPTLEDFKTKNQITNTTIFKKEIWKRVGGFDPCLKGMEDWDFWLRAVKKGYNVTVVQEFLSYYRRHASPSRNEGSRKQYDVLKDKILGKI